MADRKISELTALTTPATGDLIPIVDISEAAAADKNKSITVGELLRGAPDGTAAAPGFAFESDGNTGIYRPGADQVAISTNGTGRLFINASGNVGVGVANPVFTYGTGLEIQGAGSQTLRLERTGSTTSALELTADDGITRLDTRTSTPMTFHTAGTERARIDSSGSLLVGTSADSGGALLQVNGDRVRIATAKTPSSASDTGTAGEICWDANYIYVCTATNTWKRTAIATW